MNSLRSRLRRHLSYANVMATVAVFLAFGGVSYAAATINGKKIVNHSIGAGKLKNGTLTHSQVKKDSLTGSVIDEGSLGTVPRAKSAVSATSATSAETASQATEAKYATEAESAETAENAETAKSAESAEDAETLEGMSAGQLQVSCQTGTELFGGMCWDEEERAAHGWIQASVECGEADGRLPSLSELVAYVLQPEEQFSGPSWTSDVISVDGFGEPPRHPQRGATAISPASGSFGYRCLFYRAN